MINDRLRSAGKRDCWLTSAASFDFAFIPCSAPGKIGGYKPNILSGAHGDWLIERAKSDFTLRGLVSELAERGVKVDYVQVWRFVHARGLSFKKKRSSRRTVAAQGGKAARAVEEVPGAA